MDSNPMAGLIGFWMMLQLVATLALLLGGIYVLFCLGRAASGLDRMATAMEEWVARQNAPAANAYPVAHHPGVADAPAAPVTHASQISSPYPPSDETTR